ncbi:hypothetical protein [Arthrobacter oryzae]|uniref:hypothetical protein n=1 Tax=Arthrobacter oryzae TaxID=409290 RepID=UPI002857AF9B|nr:hypothetical protein [Arthrobacter oryzae]MDR6508753.1 hypothetical protein [Arthrobacter oryzae]
MENDSGFYAPLTYSAWLPWAGLGLLFLVAAWLAFVFLSTRQRRRAVPAAPFGPQWDPSSLKLDYLRRIDAVADDAEAGRLSARASHQELSLLIRNFVRDIAGIDAPRMTLAELHRQGIPAAAAAIRRLYPAEFGPEPRDTEPRDTEPHSSVAAAAETAREVVRTWN